MTGRVDGRKASSGVELSTLFMYSQWKSHVKDSLLYCLLWQKTSPAMEVCFYCWDLSCNAVTGSLVYLKETKENKPFIVHRMHCIYSPCQSLACPTHYHRIRFLLSHPTLSLSLFPGILPVLFVVLFPCSLNLFSVEAAVLFPAVLAGRWPCERVSF